MNFIDKEYIMTMEIGQDSCYVAGALYCRTRGNLDANPGLGSYDISQGSFAQARWAIEQYMVKCFTPPFSCSDSYAQILLNSSLTNELIKATGPEAGIKRYVFSTGFTRYNAVYFNLTPLKHPP